MFCMPSKGHSWQFDTERYFWVICTYMHILTYVILAHVSYEQRICCHFRRYYCTVYHWIVRLWSNTTGLDNVVLHSCFVSLCVVFLICLPRLCNCQGLFQCKNDWQNIRTYHTHILFSVLVCRSKYAGLLCVSGAVYTCCQCAGEHFT